MPNEHVLNPWLDFKYGDNYASDFGLIRVSNGSRYNDNLLPTLNDKTADVPGGDGMYYFNSYYKQKQFNINFAFDGLTETQLRAVRQWLNGKEIKELEFDERPGLLYSAKVTGTPSFKYIPFDSAPRISSNIVGRFYKAVAKAYISQETISNWPTDYTYPEIEGYSIATGEYFYRIAIGFTTLSELLVNAPNLSKDPVFIKNAWSKNSGKYLYTDSSTTHMPAKFLIKSQAEYNLLAQYFDLTPLLPSGEEPSEPELIYKGEGSVTFTCYDPYAYTTTQIVITGTSMEFDTLGDVPGTFILSSTAATNSNHTLTFTDISDTEHPVVLGSITILPAASGYIWNSKTGMVTASNGTTYKPVAFSGNSMLTLPPNARIKLEGAMPLTSQLIYYNRYY